MTNGSNNKKIKILCVEDEADVRESIVEILRDEGFEVCEGKNGKDGLKVFLKEKPDIVVSDIMMPDMSGHDLLKAIRKREQENALHTPFIFLSALGQKDDIIKGIKLSANDYLTKPVDFDLLIAKIKEKTYNRDIVERIHEKKVDNFKEQVVSLIPGDLKGQVEIITTISNFLKDEPYGPIGHHHYLTSIKKIAMYATRLQSVIDSALDKEVISNQLNLKDEIIDPLQSLQDIIKSLQNASKRIMLEAGIGNMPKIKINKDCLRQSIKTLLKELAKHISPSEKIRISIAVDHLEQLIFIFSGMTKDIDINNPQAHISEPDLTQINEFLERQGCHAEYEIRHNEVIMLIVIPQYRTIESRHNRNSENV